MNKFQVGQRWKTRDGRTAIIEITDYEFNHAFPAHGNIDGIKIDWDHAGGAYGDGGIRPKSGIGDDLLYLDCPH